MVGHICEEVRADNIDLSLNQLTRALTQIVPTTTYEAVVVLAPIPRHLELALYVATTIGMPVNEADIATEVDRRSEIVDEIIGIEMQYELHPHFYIDKVSRTDLARQGLEFRWKVDRYARTLRGAAAPS